MTEYLQKVSNRHRVQPLSAEEPYYILHWNGQRRIATHVVTQSEVSSGCKEVRAGIDGWIRERLVKLVERTIIALRLGLRVVPPGGPGKLEFGTASVLISATNTVILRQCD